MQLARTVATSCLPVIDIGGMQSADCSGRQAVASAIRSACRDSGFFYLAGHGVPRSLIETVHDESRRFFALPLDRKLAVGRHLSSHRRGYEPVGGQVLQTGMLPDLKEAFDLGIDLPAGDHRVIAGKPDHGPNLWPEGLTGFHSAMSTYLTAMLDLSHLVLRGLALSLDLAENYFDDLGRDPVVFLRLLHYPPQPPSENPRALGAGAHSDWGAITILWQDPSGGLQLLGQDGDWIHVPPLPDCFVVNIGDLMARWTNDFYRSTVHRVVNHSGRDRYSVPFFFDGDPDHVVACLPGCHSPQNPPLYPPTTVAAHTAEKYRLAFVRGESDG